MRSSKSRQRSKPNRPRTLGNIINRVFDSSGPEGKVRGTPQQIIEKYQFLARDAQLSNDRVAAENFMQHAEHYTRMLAEANREMAAEQEARPAYVPQNGQQNGQNGTGSGGSSGNQSRDYQSGQGQGNRNQNDRSQQDRNQNDRNQQERNQQDRNQQDRNQQDRNQNDRAQADRNQSDRNQNDRDPQTTYRNDYRDQGQDDQPGLTLVDDAGFGDSNLVETPEATRPQRPPRDEPRRDEPRRDEPRRDEPRRETFRKPRGDDRPAPAPKPVVAAEEPGLPGFLTAPLLSEGLTEPQAEPPKAPRVPRPRKPAVAKVKDEAAE